MTEQITTKTDTKIIDAIIVPYIYDPIKAEMLLRSPITISIRCAIRRSFFQKTMNED